MAVIRLVAAWDKYVVGQTIGVTSKIAENLIAQGIAYDPRVGPQPVASSAIDPKPAKPKAAKKKAKRRVRL